ncbi:MULTISPECIES: hypothetical protein [unclassified Chelatococcus]|uniref:hypothetical protein n=1 Tax=unclassified Chelatococcus TaxID=2638111 RepID=UPI001BCE0BF7|nr:MULTISPECIES: hypothetical protein [unclassified Chelatococcus]CAH1673581.1 conserved hypothetical protein [Hyphomicrobiales bacterium]MBS7738806.1 hypothetical protein [Chelatococcus sp. HY11]MBX3543210.1 hypothetical protein [Chelatococcus sp.]MCO5076664.1 hypothetical protein [Chelatococcus sp.]CAH1674162.1 conserved hypothetical protein [Hyphomicrobiales bacterium]
MDDAAPQKPLKRRPRGEAVKGFLAADRTPMWMTITMLLMGASGTYFLAPRINAEFEAQKIKTDFVIRNYSDLRTKMEDFQGLFMMSAQKASAGDDVRAEVIKLYELSGRISAQTLSMLPMFTTAEGPKATAELNQALNGMISFLVENAEEKPTTDAALKTFNTNMVAALTKMIPPLLELYVRIGDVGRLSPTEKDIDLAARK